MNSKGKSSAETGGSTALVPKLRFPEFQAEDGWKEVSLQRLARPVTDRASTGDADNILSLSGEHGLVLQSDYFGKKIAGESTDRYLKIRRDDFVYNDRTTKASSFGTIKRLSDYSGGIVSPIYKCFRFQPSENPVFWEWYFESGRHDPALGGLVNEGARAGRFNISVNQFLSTNAWRPDEAEQQRIAACLDSAEALIAAQGRKVEVLRAHKKGLMQQLFPQGGETQPRLRFPEFEGASDWEKKTGDDVTVKITKGSSPNWQGFSYQREGILFVTSENVRDGFLDVSSPKFLSRDFFEKQKNSALRYGDILINIVGASIGRSCLYVLNSDAFTNQAVALFRVNAQNCFKFISYCFQSDQIQRALNRSQSDSARPNLSLSDLRDMEFIVPSLPEQQRIADCLTSLDDLIAAESRKLDTLMTHKKGLMQKLFPAIAEFES